MSPPDRDASAAADLAAIRALLVAIARHNLIEIPQEASSLATTRNADEVDPKGSLYDEAKTIDYRTRQPGTARDIQNKEHLRPGVSSGDLWVSKTLRHDRQVGYGEFGYDLEGYPCSLDLNDEISVQEATLPGNRSFVPPRREVKEHIFKAPAGQLPSPPWLGQRFSKEW